MQEASEDRQEQMSLNTTLKFFSKTSIEVISYWRSKIKVTTSVSNKNEPSFEQINTRTTNLFY